MNVKHHEICKELCGELEDMAKRLSSGDLDPSEFRALLNKLETRKLERHGMTLSSFIEKGIVHFSLRFAGSGELCANMDADPKTGKLSTELACEQK